MFNYDEKRFFTPPPVENDCPSYRNRSSLPERVEHTSRMLKDTLDRLMIFEKTMKDKYDDLFSIMTQDNVTFKELMQDAYSDFVSSVRTEINLFETNTSSLVTLFKEAINNRLTEFNENYSESFADYQKELSDYLISFEDTIRNEFNLYKADVNNIIAQHISRFDNQDAKIDDAVAYMKSNLNINVANLLNQMHESGELIGVIETDIITPVRKFGAMGDGHTDDTAAIQAVIDEHDNVLIDNGTFIISDTLNLKTGTVITVRNAKIISNASENKKYIFRLSGVKNVKILGDNGELEMNKVSTTQQACISIENCSNIMVDGLTLAKAGGDGITIGGSETAIAKNITVRNCVIDNNRRNGISLIGGVNGVYIYDNIIKNTNGVEPQCGIDIETWVENLLNENINIERNTFENNVNGALIVFEYSKRINVRHNVFNENVSVKVNNAYESNQNANPTDVTFEGNTFNGTLYFYRILHGGFTVISNTFNNGSLYIEHSINAKNADAESAKAKIVSNNIFNGLNCAISVGNNANMLINANIANDCKAFFDAYGVYNVTVKNNIVNGYNVGGDKGYIFGLNGICKTVMIENNIVRKTANSTIVNRVLQVSGGSVENSMFRNNNLIDAEFTSAAYFAAINDNIAYGNASASNMDRVSVLPTASEKFAGVIVTHVQNGELIPRICVKVNDVWRWQALISA